jgi:hypothetical protein
MKKIFYKYNDKFLQFDAIIYYIYIFGMNNNNIKYVNRNSFEFI